MRFAALKMKTGKISEADRLYSAAYQLDPTNPQLAIERSVVLESIDKNQALEVLTNARETLDPDCKFPDLHINLGKLIGIGTYVSKRFINNKIKKVLFFDSDFSP